MSIASTSETPLGYVEEEKKEEKSNMKIIPLKKPPVESLQEVTAGDQAITAFLHKKFGEKLDTLQSDVVIRFVRGYAHDKDRQAATVERLRYYLECFEKYQLSTIANESWAAEKDCLEAWPVFMYGVDHQGHPVLYDEVCCSSPSQVETAFGGDSEKLKKFRLRIMRRLAIRKENLSKKHGVLIYKHVMVMDVSKASMSTLNKFKTLVQNVINEEQHLFPETLYKLYIVNAPWTFQWLWKIVSNFIDRLTYQKIEVLGTNYLEEMLKIMDKDQIPPKYGGTCLKPIVFGHDSEEYEDEQLAKRRRTTNKK